MDTWLVTGGAGFIGGWFVRTSLAELSVRVVNLDKLTYAGNLDSLDSVRDEPRHVFVQGDIADTPLVERLLAEHAPRAILNFAAETHVDRSIDGPAPFIHTNVVGVQRLLDAALGYWRGLPPAEQREFRFLHVSTDEVFGSLGASGRFDETTPYAPHSPYAASKAAADHLTRAYHHTFGLPTLITNCSNNFGPFQFPEKLIPLMILNALEEKPLPVYGDGLHVRDWLYVADHCRALRAVLARGIPGETYCVGGANERTNLDVVRSICHTVDRLRPAGAPRERLITHVVDRPGHDRRYAIDFGRIERELGWRPETPFERALTETVRWYIDNAAWVERVTTGVYQRQRLGAPRS